MTINYKMTLQYDGRKYNGWQKQGNTANTIQGKLESHFSDYFNQNIEVNGSGRTDAGVHARGQVASFKVDYPDEKKETSQLLYELNLLLPEDIRILDICEADNRFHARLNAKAKEYCYYISLDKKRDVFEKNYMAYQDCGCELDIEKMKEASKLLIGKKDFACFSDNRSNKSSVRTIYSIDFEVKDNKLCIKYYGDGFLYHMVRLITATLVEIGKGNEDIQIINEIFNSNDRKRIKWMAPAGGLFLCRVDY